MTFDELGTLRTAARRDDPIAVMDGIERVHATFERDRVDYRRSGAMATLLDQSIEEGVDDVARDYREGITELEQRWIELNRSTLTYVQDESSAETLVESVDAVAGAYRECERRIETLETTVSDVSVPPLLIVSGDPMVEASKGTTVSRELILFNVGRSHADSISVDTESEVTMAVVPSSLDGLKENGSELLRVDLSPSTAGEFDAYVTATGEATVDRFRFTLHVLTKGAYVDRAGRLARSLEMSLDSVLPEGGRGNGLTNRIRTLRRRLESISDALESRRRPKRSIDNQLNAARNSAEAVEREITSLEPSVERQELLYALESLKKAIDDAIEALP